MSCAGKTGTQVADRCIDGQSGAASPPGLVPLPRPIKPAQSSSFASTYISQVRIVHIVHKPLHVLYDTPLLFPSSPLPLVAGRVPSKPTGREEAWGSLTCGRLVEMAETVRAKINEGARDGGAGRGSGLQFEKLTHGFWRRFIRREVLLAGGEGGSQGNNKKTCRKLSRWEGVKALR